MADTPVQPGIDDLLAKYLHRQAESHRAGSVNLDAEGEVHGYDAGPVQPVDAQLAWNETLAVARLYGCERETQALRPAGWPALVAGHEPIVTLACALGNFPQMLRHFHTILQTADVTQLRPGSVHPGPAERFRDLLDWADSTVKAHAFPESLLVIGTLRLAKQFEHADRIVKGRGAKIPAKWRWAWDNERAALAWHRGDSEEARKLWQGAEATPVVLFNRGMSSLFLGHAEEARAVLKDAVESLPANEAWHHLGRLYLTLSANPR